LNPNAKIKAYQNGSHQEVDIHYDYETKNHLITPLQIEAQDLLEIEVTIPTGELIISDDHRLAMCRRMLSAYPLESWAKMRLNKHLPAILEEPAGLSEFELDLTERQMGGLLEVLYGAGIGHVTLRDQVGEEIILWNNHRYSDIRYHFVARDLNGRTTHRRGPLPDFAVLRSERDVLPFQQREDIQKRFSAAVEWLYSLPRRIQISGAKGIDAVVQLDINGDGGFQSHFIIQDGHALKRQGRHKTPNVELRSQAEDFLAFVNGDVSPIELYEGGKLGVIGSIELLLSFYQGLDYLPRDSFQAKDWKLEIDYQDLLRLTHKT
jgi:hypothetical protein